MARRGAAMRGKGIWGWGWTRFAIVMVHGGRGQAAVATVVVGAGVYVYANDCYQSYRNPGYVDLSPPWFPAWPFSLGSRR